MKILFIITQSEIGGAQRFLLEFAPYLARQGHEVIVAAGEGDDELFCHLEEKLAKSTPADGGGGLSSVKISSLVRNLNPIKDIRALLSILRIVRKKQSEIVFLQSTKAGFLGSLAVKLYLILNTKYKIQVIYRIGGWAFNDPRPWWMNQIVFWMEKLSARWKDVIIVNSEYDKQLAIQKKIVPAEMIVKIYNGIDPDKLNFLPREEARSTLVSCIKYHVLRNRNIILVGTIANLYATKGIEYLIESARQLYIIHNTKYLIQFIVLGDGPERPKLEALIKKYNLENNFFLLGRIPNATQYLKAFDVFVLPSVKEGFPWVLLESMAAEVPIIATKVGAVPEVIEDGKDGLLVAPKNSKALAEKIQQLLAPKTLHIFHDRERYVKNAREKLKQFTLQKMLEETKRATIDTIS